MSIISALTNSIRKMMYTLVCLTVLLGGTACDNGSRNDTTGKTTIMFFPWSSNLLPYFQQNIQDFSSVIAQEEMKKQRVIVCLATSPDEMVLIELKRKKKQCVADTLHHYCGISFTGHENLTALFTDIVDIAPAEKYSMIIGSHGMAWLPIDHETPQQLQPIQHLHYQVESPIPTRFFGGLTAEYQIEIADLALGIKNAGLKMEYILFDDCYMSSVEVAYELREATDHIIASPTEIIAYGFPYHKCGKYLLGNTDYNAIINKFHQFYSNYIYPYGTAAVIDCREMGNLALIVKEIHNNKKEDNGNHNIQAMDGYYPTLFYDFGDYIRSICDDNALFDNFTAQLNRTVPYKCHTTQYYSAFTGAMPIRHYSGITTSESSQNTMANTYESTAWHIATH